MSFLKKEWLLRWWPAALMMFLIFMASSTPGNDVPGFGSADFVVKKGGHMTGYALLAVAYLYGLGNRSTTRRFWLAAFLGACFYAVTDEFHQSFVPGRDPSGYDVMIDSAGALLGASLWIKLKRTQKAAGSQNSPRDEGENQFKTND